MPDVSHEPSNVANEQGDVHITGPNGIDLSMTPAAALETAKRLDAAAIDALLDGVAQSKGA
jgi:hypothetical protein